MSHNVLLNTSLHHKLLDFDTETADRLQAQGCPHCGGRLHQANYPRLGFGVNAEISSIYSQRLSFCCGRCRRRTTPPSVRFFGQRRFIAPVFIIVCALRLSISEQRCAQLAKRFGLHVSVSTWRRWRRWWNLSFLSTRFWIAAKALIPVIDTTACVPRQLLRPFIAQHFSHRLYLLLRFLSPLSVAPR